MFWSVKQFSAEIFHILASYSLLIHTKVLYLTGKFAGFSRSTRHLHWQQQQHGIEMTKRRKKKKKNASFFLCKVERFFHLLTSISKWIFRVRLILISFFPTSTSSHSSSSIIIIMSCEVPTTQLVCKPSTCRSAGACSSLTHSRSRDLISLYYEYFVHLRMCSAFIFRVQRMPKKNLKVTTNKLNNPF